MRHSRSLSSSSFTRSFRLCMTCSGVLRTAVCTRAFARCCAARRSARKGKRTAPKVLDPHHQVTDGAVVRLCTVHRAVQQAPRSNGVPHGVTEIKVILQPFRVVAVGQTASPGDRVVVQRLFQHHQTAGVPAIEGYEKQPVLPSWWQGKRRWCCSRNALRNSLLMIRYEDAHLVKMLLEGLAPVHAERAQPLVCVCSSWSFSS